MELACDILEYTKKVPEILYEMFLFVNNYKHGNCTKSGGHAVLI